PDAAPATRQSSSAPAPESTGAPQRDRPPLLLRHRRPRLTGGAALCLESVRRRPPRGGERLPGAARVRDVPSEFSLPERVEAAGRGRRQDPPPQRPDRPGSEAPVGAGGAEGPHMTACDEDRGLLGDRS